MAQRLKSKKALDKIWPYMSKHNNLDYYLKRRSEFNTGDLLFFSGNHWLSGLIRWRSLSAWSHVGMVVKIDDIDRLFLVESILESGVRLLPLSFVFSNYDGGYHEYNGRVAWAKHEILENNTALQKKLSQFCLDNLTKQYDRAEYWRILWRSIVGMDSFFEDDKYTCAEYIYEAFKYAGITLPKEKGYFISPGAFWRLDEVKLKSILV